MKKLKLKNPPIKRPRTFLIKISTEEEWDKAVAKLNKTGHKFGANVEYNKGRDLLVGYYEHEPYKLFHVDAIRDWPRITCEEFMTRTVSFSLNDEVADGIFMMSAADKKKLLDEHMKWQKNRG
jgi:hypothetical protein